MRVAGLEQGVLVGLGGLRDRPMRGWRSGDRMCRPSATIVAGGSAYSDLRRSDGRRVRWSALGFRQNLATYIVAF